MKFIDENNWVSRIRQNAVGMLLGLSLLFTATTIEAANIGVQYLGCKAKDGNGYEKRLVHDIHPGHEDFMMYFCKPSAYTHGELGTWAELDMVPFHLRVENKTNTPQSFTFKAGGAYEPHGTNPGWDYITEFTLDEEATIAAGGNVTACKQHGATTSQEIIYENGGIYRQVIIDDFPGNLICVPTFNMRLAIGSGVNSGASLHATLETERQTIGKKSVPVKVNQNADFSKTMTATQDSAIGWTITKTSSPGNIDFTDTCTDDASALVKDIDITVTWEKGEPTPEGKVEIQTVISATNNAKRVIDIDVTDTLYKGATELEVLSCDRVTLPVQTGSHTICTHTFTIDEEDAVDPAELWDKAVATYIDPDHPGIEISYQAEAIGMLVNGVITPGSNRDGTAIIKDNEWIVGNDLNYSVESVTGADGSFTGYTLKEITNGDINWTSVTQGDDDSVEGSVVFRKKIYATKATAVTGHLGDIALLDGSDGFHVETNPLNVSISSSAYVSLTINKSVNQDIIDENKDLNFEFSIRKEGADPQVVTIHIPAGESFGTTTISGMEPGIYNVQELTPPGYATVGDNTKIVDLNLPTCKTTIEFENELAGRPAVKVKKVTFPATIGDADQGAGWNITLQRETNDGWEDVNSSTTTGSDTWLTLVTKDHLTEGHYRIIETPKEGWYQVGVSEDCEFTYTADETRDDFECSFGNAKYAKIIIKKEIDSVQTYSEKFNFTQDIDDETLSLGDEESKTYQNLQAMSPGNASSTFHVSENDPAPAFALENLVCEEYYAPGITAIENSTVDLDYHREAIIVLDPGETVACTFTNKKVEHPSIIIEKSTNTEDADVAPGPHITVGDPVNWAYVIQNTGDVVLNGISVTDNQGVTVSCQETTLNIGEIMTCTASGTASQGQYSNLGTVTARTPEGATTSNEDPSHYFGEAAPVEHPSIVIEKSTNGQDADTPTGPTIIVGSSVNWRYIVHNNGDVALSNITVNDNKIGAITCPQTALAVGASMTCTDSGIAIEGQYANIGTVTAKTPDSATVTDTDPSHYLGELAPVEEHPSILIEKSTNGEDADVAPGPYISVGDPVNWEYVIYNNGDVDLNTINIIDSQGVRISCPATVLAVGKSMTCAASGTATEGQYSNLGTVTARSPEGATASNEDPSHYFGEEVPAEEHPSIDIEKYTNGEDADTAGPSIPVGETVTWTYVVHNTGDVNLRNISVTDDQGVEVSCPKTTLEVDEEMTCTASGTAVEGSYTNIGTVTSRSPEGTTTTDDDTSHYLGAALPSMNIEKSTNGEDADVAPGPKIVVNSPIEWTYTIHNTGNVPLREITVTDDQEVEVSCPQTTLEVDETMTCTAMGTATIGQYKNIGTVTAIASEDIQVSDEDTSHYLGTDSAVDPEEGENCPCNDVKSDSSSTFGTVSAILMMLMTLMAGLFFVRREELLNRNER